MSIVVSLLYRHLVDSTKYRISCQVWVFAGAIAQMISEGASSGESNSWSCSSRPNSLPLSNTCSAGCSAFRGDQMGCERSMDHLRPALYSHHYSCDFHYQAILQSVHSHRVHEMISPTNPQRVSYTIRCPVCACRATRSTSPTPCFPYR
jgi:hypothetical protein